MVVTAVTSFSLIQSASAQGPVRDRIMVKFDRPVQVGTRTLQAGEYTIHQVTSASNPRILEFTSNNGTQLEATVAAIPIMQNTAPTETKVVIEDEGGGARLARIWVQGKTYGYEFPGKTAVASQTTAPTLEASYQASKPANTERVEAAQNVETPQNRDAANRAGANPPAATEALTTNQDANTNKDAAATTKETLTTSPETTTPTQVSEPQASVTEKPAPQQEPTVIAQAKPQEQPMVTPGAANQNRAADSDVAKQDTPTMPVTDLGWLSMMLIGLSLTVSSGLIIYWVGLTNAD